MPTPLPDLHALDIVQFNRSHPEGHPCRDAVIQERPLRLEVDSATYTLLRTPGADRELAVGFLFTEGLISSADDILMLGECPDSPDVIRIKTAAPGNQPPRALMITSSCGLCGREDMHALVAALGCVESTLRAPLATLYQLPAAVRPLQPLFEATGGAHAAALFDPSGRITCVREDVGRHNALDRVIGHATRREVHARHLRHRAVHVFLFNPQGRLFIQKRAAGKDTFPLCYDSSASGHVDRGESYEACAARELEEELGLRMGGS